MEGSMPLKIFFLNRKKVGTCVRQWQMLLQLHALPKPNLQEDRD